MSFFFCSFGRMDYYAQQKIAGSSQKFSRLATIDNHLKAQWTDSVSTKVALALWKHVGRQPAL